MHCNVWYFYKYYSAIFGITQYSTDKQFLTRAILDSSCLSCIKRSHNKLNGPASSTMHSRLFYQNISSIDLSQNSTWFDLMDECKTSKSSLMILGGSLPGVFLVEFAWLAAWCLMSICKLRSSKVNWISPTRLGIPSRLGEIEKYSFHSTPTAWDFPHVPISNTKT